ncbi:glycosyltransferase [Lysobacter xanthus]
MTDIPDIIEWSRSQRMGERPWLMLGKGPSFRKLAGVDTSAFGLLALNHVVRERPVDIAHAIDLDVVRDCGDAILANASVLWMPMHPHVECKPSRRTLYDWAAEMPVLRRLVDEGRLAWYNAASSKIRVPGSPVVNVRFFSAEAALYALALCGARTVRSLGIDGGASYAAEFDDLRDSTLLANGHPSFDRQFAQFAAIIRSTGVFYAPLHVHAPVRVFVGTDRTQQIGFRVLEYSIRRHASMSVQVQAIDDTDIPMPRDPAQRARTGFSFSRFRIPELCGHRGRALYMDADMQVFSDVLRLWTMPFEGARVLYAESDAAGQRSPQFSVMLLDCAALDWDVARIVGGLDSGEYGYADLMQQLCIVPEAAKRAGLPPEWNSLEHYQAGRTHLLHYTDMPTQPWICRGNRNGALFYAALRDAVDEGAIERELIYDEVARGHVSPDLPKWIGLPPVHDDARLLREWVPPYKRLLAPSRTASGQAA